MPSIQFINHSSVLIKDKDTRILCDPWYKGLAFQDGWALLHDQSHDINELNFDYIWISHEHPDHFSIATLTDLSKSTRFIYQKTKDNKVKNFLEQKGHEVIILEDSIPKKIGDIELTLFICDGYDSSLLCTFSDGKQFLNINDARVDLPEEMNKIKKKIKNLDTAAVQFSYANWAGNQQDVEIASHQQQLVDIKNREICTELKPNKLLLFASFIYYCHEENFYWNDNFWFNHVLEALEFKETQFILPIPDQNISIGTPVDNLQEKNTVALKFWKNLHHKAKPIIKTIPLNNLEELEEIYKSFFSNLWNKNSLESCITPTNEEFSLLVRIKDFDLTLELGLFTYKFLKSDEEPDCEMTSETLFFMLKNKFSRGTISVNSRLSFNYPSAHRFFIFFFIFYSNNIGIYFSTKQLTKKELRKISNTSIMTSIFKFNPRSQQNFEDDLLRFKS